jgi:hypothetical protein
MTEEVTMELHVYKKGTKVFTFKWIDLVEWEITWFIMGDKVEYFVLVDWEQLRISADKVWLTNELRMSDEEKAKLSEELASLKWQYLTAIDNIDKAVERLVTM